MSNIIAKYWNKPYPSFDSKKESLIISLALGFFVFIFLYVFRPFEIGKDTQNPLLYSAGFGLITFVINLLIAFTGLLIPERIIDRKKWKLKHTFFIAIINLGAIAIANYYFILFMYPKEDPANVWEVLFYTISVGIFPVSLVLIISEHQLSKERKKTALKAMNLIREREQSIERKPKGNSTIDIKSDVKSDNFAVNSDDLLLIKADGNYSTFFIKKGNGYEKKIARIPLIKVEELLKENLNFVKCHRSYIVNIQKVSDANGNARNVTLCIDNMQIKVPVSRSKEKIVLTAIGHI